MVRKILLFYPSWLKVFENWIRHRLYMYMLSNIFFSPFLLCSDSEGKPTALKFHARWDRVLPGGLQLQGILQSPAVFLASNLRHPDFLPTQLCWQETRQSSPGLLCWFCWSYWKNKWSLGNIFVLTGWQTQTWKASRRVLFKAFSSAVSKGAVLRSSLSCNCVMPH